jgi:glucuronate isomerase
MQRRRLDPAGEMGMGAGDIARGEIPHDMELVGGMVKNICFANARGFFGLELAPEFMK